MLHVHDDRIPLTEDDNGVLRVTGTRVSLDSVVDLYDFHSEALSIHGSPHDSRLSA